MLRSAATPTASSSSSSKQQQQQQQQQQQLSRRGMQRAMLPWHELLPSDVEREQAWRIWDVDGDGSLDLDEVTRAITLSFPELAPSPGALRRAFKAADNGDGLVSRREFRMLLEYIGYFTVLVDKFKQIDTDGSGTLSISEFTKGSAVLGLRTRGGQPLSTHAIASHFKAMDADGSGTVDFDEFAVWAVHQQVGRPPNTGRTAGQTETPEYERREREQEALRASSATQIYSPWKARAIGRYPQDDNAATLHSSDLQFDVGDIVSVTSKHCETWWTGAAHGRHGTFPRTLVKLLPPGSRDAEVQAIEHEEARTRVRTRVPPRGGSGSGGGGGGGGGGNTAGARSAAPPAAGIVTRRDAGVGGARTPHARPALVLPTTDELARTFRLWDPNGFGELGVVELRGLVKTLWPQFDHPMAFDRSCRALRLEEIGAGAVHSVPDLGLFLKAVAYCEQHYDASEYSCSHVHSHAPCQVGRCIHGHALVVG